MKAVLFGLVVTAFIPVIAAGFVARLVFLMAAFGWSQATLIMDWLVDD